MLAMGCKSTIFYTVTVTVTVGLMAPETSNGAVGCGEEEGSEE